MALDLGTLTGWLELDDKKFDSTLNKLPGKLEMSGAAMKLVAGAAALAIGAAIAGGITNAIELDDANRKITANLSLTEEESARIGGVAGKLYADAYGESVQDVNAAVESVVSSFDGMRNASSESIEGVTAKLLDLQTAMGIDVARSAQVAGQAVKAGLADTTDQAIDLLVANLQRVPASLREDLLDAVDEYGPILANLGYSGEEAFGMLANAADKGMYGIDKTGDALKELSIRATDMSTTSVAAYEAAGLNAEQMSARIAEGGESARSATNEIIQALLGIQDPVARANAAIGLFGTPLEDLGVQEIPEFLDQLAQVGDGFGSAEGAAAKMGETLNGSASVGWTTIQRQFEAILGTVGGALLPILTELLDWVMANPAVLQVMAAAVGILAVAFIGLTVATWAMNTALLANPITWIILGIVALIAAIVLLIANWDEVVSFLRGAWEGFLSWFGGVMDGFFAWWNGLWAGFGAGVAAGWEAVVAWFQNLPAAIGAFFAGVGDWLLGVGEMLLQGLATGIALGIMFVIYYFTQLPFDILNLLVGVGTWLVQTGLDLLVGLYNGVTTGWAALVAWFQALPTVILSFLISAGIWLAQTGSDLINGLLAGISNGWNATVAWFQALPGRVLSFLVSAASWLVGTGRDLISGLLTGIQNFWGSVISFFQNLPSTILGFFAGIGSWLFNAGRDLINGLLGGIRSLAGTIGSFFLNLLPDWIVGPFKAAMGIASPSKLFRGFGRNLASSVLLGAEDEQSKLNMGMRDLLSVPDVSVGASMAAAMTGPQAGAQAQPAAVSLQGATLVIDAGEGKTIVGVVREEILDASEERKGQIINGTGEVVFS